MAVWLQPDTVWWFMFASFVWIVQVVHSVISDLLDQAVRVGWTVSKTFNRKLIDEVSDWFNKEAVQMRDGSDPKIVLWWRLALKK
jgi:hypothetical protein